MPYCRNIIVDSRTRSGMSSGCAVSGRVSGDIAAATPGSGAVAAGSLVIFDEGSFMSAPERLATLGCGVVQGRVVGEDGPSRNRIPSGFRADPLLARSASDG